MSQSYSEEYTIQAGSPTVEEYQSLRSQSGLSAKSEQAAEIGLRNSYHSVLVLHQGKRIGMGRIIGDGGCFFQIVDIAVLPEHQGKGLGKRIMAQLMDYLEANAPRSAYVSLIADTPADKLYEKFGFAYTAPRSVGMYKRL